MPDILKVTTPLVNKNQVVSQKTPIDPTNPFAISDASRVMRTHNQSDIAKQNTGLNGNNDAPVLLMNLLKDPAVAVTYLKNIFLLEEIFKLLPANNKTVTPEIEQIFQELIVQTKDIKKELVRQESASTQFKGGLFDFLREVSKGHKATPQVQMAIATLLKSINNLTNKSDILDAVANSLTFLRENLNPSTTVYGKIQSLIDQYRQSDAEERFPLLKEQTLAVLKEVESSLLFSPKLSKVLSIIVYNLSRYNDSNAFFNESAYRLRKVLKPEDLKEYIKRLDEFTALMRGGAYASGGPAGGALESKVMDALIRLVSKQADNENLGTADAAKIDKILHSLLSSPCNFTPLLHFIVPVMYEDMKAFAEVWINPESDEKDMPEGANAGKHFLLVIDVDAIGRFEAELFVHDRIIDFHLYCPMGYDDKYQGMMDNLPSVFKKLNYKLGKTKLETLDRPRSLMDVFKSLPYKRVGVDVKI